ncbi:MAG: hypothetical protein HKM24_06380 [Gammaproteobacteria bacterium]|nr:hypothetical protein [Gammaproteobacteria bacterium]
MKHTAILFVLVLAASLFSPAANAMTVTSEQMLSSMSNARPTAFVMIQRLSDASLEYLRYRGRARNAVFDYVAVLKRINAKRSRPLKVWHLVYKLPESTSARAIRQTSI